MPALLGTRGLLGCSQVGPPPCREWGTPCRTPGLPMPCMNSPFPALNLLFCCVSCFTPADSGAPRKSERQHKPSCGACPPVKTTLPVREVSECSELQAPREEVGGARCQLPPTPCTVVMPPPACSCSWETVCMFQSRFTPFIRQQHIYEVRFLLTDQKVRETNISGTSKDVGNKQSV